MNGNKTTITIYTKYCAECMWPKEMTAIKNYAQHFGHNLKIKRTTYRPSLHKKASEICGSEEYKVFVVVNKAVFGLKEFAEICRDDLEECGNDG